MTAAILAALLFSSVRSAICGAAAYRLLADFEDDLDDGNLIEIGSDRGEGSTRWLAEFAAKHHRNFYTVDFSAEGYRNGQRACGGCAFKGMGENFLTGQIMLCLVWSRLSLIRKSCLLPRAQRHIH